MSEETVFLAALEHKSPAERAAFLDTACAGDVALRQRVEALLSSHADPDSFLDIPAVVRQAEGTDEPAQTVDPPASSGKDDMRTASAVGLAPTDQTHTFLGPASKPGTLGWLDHYEILEKIGHGGMGVVFKAKDTRLHQIVAIKVLASHLADSGIARQRFFREARSAAAIHDDHVVTIHLVSDEAAPTPYLVMELIAGITLEDRIKKTGALKLKEILRIGMQTARGLWAAHRQGLIHRDIKPANILLENGVERVKITDFGLARTSEDINFSQPGMIAGTPPYMSPEQARGDTLDQRSDLFSLGSVLYTMCTGKQAFAAGNSIATLKRVCEETPRPVRELNPDIPEPLADVVEKLLAKKPEERYQSAAEVAQVLEELLAKPPHPLPKLIPIRKWKPIGVAAAILLVGVATTLAIVAGMRPPQPVPSSETPPLLPDPRVLTVSKNPKDGARFSTIQAALDEVQPGMTVRVLDDAVYEENLAINRPIEHRGLILEATGNATIRDQPGGDATVEIRNVPNVTLRGFHFICEEAKNHDQVRIVGRSPGVILEYLDMLGHTNNENACIQITDVPMLGDSDPIIIRNCTIRKSYIGILLRGHVWNDHDHPAPIHNVIICNNILKGCCQGVLLKGKLHAVHVVGNRIIDSNNCAINVIDPLVVTAHILFANNSILGCNKALCIFDDHDKGKLFQKCKNIQFQNNLVFKTLGPDMRFYNHHRGVEPCEPISGPDLPSLLTSSEWFFGHNCRDIDETTAKQFDDWIPRRPTDRVLSPQVLSTKLGDPNFLRPPKDSPLARGGAGETDPSLPVYVGAVPPEGVQPWDWQKTWDMLNRRPKDDPRVLTVSKNPKDRARFNTIQAALDEVQPEMTIRVLDDAVYGEHLRIDRPFQHRGIVLEAIRKATIRQQPGGTDTVQIINVSGLTLRGFRLEGLPVDYAQVFIEGDCSGLILDDLDMSDNEIGDHRNTGILLSDILLGEKAAPIVIQNCIMKKCAQGVFVRGYVRLDNDRPLPVNCVVIRNNIMDRCYIGVDLEGAAHEIHVVGNRIKDPKHGGVDLRDLLPGSANILVANNTIVGSDAAVRIWDDHMKAKAFRECKSIRVQNNLIFKTLFAADIVFSNHDRANDYLQAISPVDLPSLLKSPEWVFSHNCRDVDEKLAKQTGRWIPLQPTDRVLVPQVLSTKLGDPNFLRPPKDSPLAWCGVGGDIVPASQIAFAVGHSSTLTNPWLSAWAVGQPRNLPDRSLPAYVGAVPPEGVEPWDWMKTWKMRTR